MMGVVLAGGKSTRLGTDKALLPWGQGTLLEHASSLLAQGLDIPTARVRVSGERPGFSCIADRHESAGPMAGVAASLTALLELPLHERPSAVVFLPVDMPRLRPERLSQLAAALSSVEAAAFDDQMLPFACRLTAAARDCATEVAAHTDRSVLRFLTLLDARWLPRDDLASEELMSVNTAEEWEKLRPK